MSRSAVATFIAASIAAACGCSNDPLAEARGYAVDPIPCAQDSDCCVVNDGCRSTAYVVASRDSTEVSSLIASADNSSCNGCVTPMLQLSCGPSHACVAERINQACDTPMMPYPGSHCGKLDLPASCLSSTSSNDAGAENSTAEMLKPLGVFICGG